MEDQPVLIEQELLQPAASSEAEGEKKRQTASHEEPKESTTITITGPGMHFAREISAAADAKPAFSLIHRRLDS